MSELAVSSIECVESRDDYGRIVAEPLEKGFGVTLGNALRRVLLGKLPGAAVTQVSIEGIQHEFSAIPNVKEDTMEFFLNVKALRIKPLAGRTGKLILEASGEKEVKAADIQPSNDFEIANPELYLATLDSPEARLYAEFEVELGRGYKTAESSDDLPVDVIPLDAIFTPVIKVNYTIEPIHIGRETSLERLNIEVWTDGTISPAGAISQAAEILMEQLKPFADYSRVDTKVEEKEAETTAIPEEKYNMSVEQLDLSVRTMNCLRHASITTIGELVGQGERELLGLRNFGQKSLTELKEKLQAIGVSLSPSGVNQAEGEQQINL